jgi:YceI-like domain
METDLSVDVRSMTTFHPQRDEGMLSADVFDADTWPVIRFISSGCRRVSSGGLFEIKGLLTIRGVGVPLEMMASLACFGALAGVQGNVGDEVNFFGEMRLRRSAVCGFGVSASCGFGALPPTTPVLVPAAGQVFRRRVKTISRRWRKPRWMYMRRARSFARDT